MKRIAICLCAVLMPEIVVAKPLTDLIFGAAFMITGGVFEVQRGKAKEDKEEATKKATDRLTNAIVADENAFYYQGAADWELVNFGQTSLYFSLLNTASSWSRTAVSEAASGVQFSSDASDSRDKQNLYKGVSLTSFGIGSVFIIKGAIVYFVQKSKENSLVSQSEEPKWTKNFQLLPTKDLSGVQLQWTCKWAFPN